jgi:hypothetical protein
VPSDDVDPTDVDDNAEDDFDPVLLNKVERSGAAILGLLATLAGTWAVFTTENQAGSAALILIGAAFCLMGVQGTPLIRFGSGDNSLVLERRRKRQRVQMVLRSAESTQELEAIVEGVSILDPRLVRSPSWQSSIYETRVTLAIKSLGALVSRLDTDTVGADLSVQWNPEGSEGGQLSPTRSRRSVDVVLKHLSEGQRLRLSQVPRREFARGEFMIGLVLVTNAPLSATIEEYLSDTEDRGVEVVVWNGDDDNAALAAALRHAAGPSTS